MYKKLHRVMGKDGYSSRGFSLVELLIVITLTVLIISAASSMIVTSLLSNGRVNTVKTLKENGDYAMGQMTTRLRNAVKLLPNDAGQLCEQDMDSIRFQSFDQGITTFSRVEIDSDDARIASGSGTIYLTSDAVFVVDPIEFDCEQSADGLITTVRISFTMTKGNPSGDRITDYASQRFESSATIRSY